MGLLEAHEAMKGKFAVVIGGAAGHLGRGVSLGLAREGVRIITCDNDREGLETIVGEVEALGSTVTPIHGDVMEPASLDAFYDEVEKLTGHIDILVNVPGGVARALFENTTRASHAENIRYNYGYHIDSCARAAGAARSSTSPRSRRIAGPPLSLSMPAPRRRSPISAGRWRSSSART
jgi:NAD(P)-dependent dehydrogenase (short-subunit alcohol dehydrogenase family)